MPFMKAAADIAKSHFSWIRTYQTITMKGIRHKPQNKQLILPICEGLMLLLRKCVMSAGLMCVTYEGVYMS